MRILTRAALRELSEVRLVGPNLNKIVKLEDALQQAEDKGLDLVLVSDQSDPPVVRIQDYKKIEYEKKKARKQQQSKHKSVLKEVQFKANISDHDFETKIGRIKKFLERGDKVKILVRLRGREREHPERAQAIITRVTEVVECKATPLKGPIAMAILEPLK